MVSTLHLLAPDLPTGTAKQIGYLVEGLASCGHTNRICSLEHDQVRKLRLQRFLPQVDYCRQPLPLDPTIVIRCATKIRQTVPDIVHCWGSHRSVLLQLALRLAGVTHVVWSVRSRAESLCLPRSRRQLRVVSNALHVADSLAQDYRVDTVANAVVAAAAPQAVTPLHHELELEPNSIFIAAMGDLRREKRLQDVTWAFDLLRVIHPNVHLVILGDGEFEPDLRMFVRAAASSAGVHLLGFRRDVGQILRQCSCFWQMCEDEGCSNALLEAMSIRLPIVVSDTPGHREVLPTDRWGSLVALGDCAAMARKTNVMLRESQAGGEHIQPVSQHFMNRYALDAMLTSYQRIYGTMLHSQPAAA